MKNITYLLCFTFSFYFFDLNILRRKRLVQNNQNLITFAYEDSKAKRTEKKKKRINQLKFKQRIYYRQKTYKFKTIKPKDKRFSDQKLLRRMYRNA